MAQAEDSSAAIGRARQGAGALPLRHDLATVVCRVDGRAFRGRWEVAGPLLHVYSDYGDAVTAAGSDAAANTLLAQDLLAVRVRDLVRRPAVVECELDGCRFSGRWKRVGDQVVMTSDYGIDQAPSAYPDDESIARSLLERVVDRWKRA